MAAEQAAPAPRRCRISVETEADLTRSGQGLTEADVLRELFADDTALFGIPPALVAARQAHFEYRSTGHIYTPTVEEANKDTEAKRRQERRRENKERAAKQRFDRQRK